ncbi:hypothetical protein INR49_031874 [Caranx melampygus]|nr:hypothetical protein INR49_031874 [Caranx melampygus]
MNVHLALLLCCFSALPHGNTMMLFTKNEGEDFKADFMVTAAGKSRKFFCRNNCTGDDLLIQTQGRRAQRDRYVIRYDGVLHVVITELRRSDTGRYRLGVQNVSSPVVSQEFQVRVTAALTCVSSEQCEGGVVYGAQRVYSSSEGGQVTVQCSLSAAKQNRKFLCRDECQKVLTETIDVRANSGKYSIEYESRGFFNVTISQLTSSDSGRYRCGVGRQSAENTCQEFEVIVRDGVTSPLVVSLIVTLLLAVSLLFLYKWRRQRSSDVILCWRSSTTSTEFAPGSTLEGPIYENPDSPTYETLNQQNESTYSTLQQQI